jgi:hypothetical protein
MDLGLAVDVTGSLSSMVVGLGITDVGALGSATRELIR